MNCFVDPGAKTAIGCVNLKPLIVETPSQKESMTLREVTRTVISLVENVSGCPLVVSENASLKTLAASRIARGANRIHTISYNPTTVREPDYLICYQCGFILRLFGVAESDRVDLARSPEGRQIV